MQRNITQAAAAVVRDMNVTRAALDTLKVDARNRVNALSMTGRDGRVVTLLAVHQDDNSTLITLPDTHALTKWQEDHPSIRALPAWAKEIKR